jgi:hypothetical protein
LCGEAVQSEICKEEAERDARRQAPARNLRFVLELFYRGPGAHGDLQSNAAPDTLRQIDIIPAALSQFRFQVKWRTSVRQLMLGLALTGEAEYWASGFPLWFHASDGDPEVISSSVGLVPRNALVLTGPGKLSVGPVLRSWSETGFYEVGNSK